MTSNGYHDTGEEWAQMTTYRQDLVTRDASVEILLYDDSTDALADADDVGAITSEPASGNYARQVITLDSADVSLSQQDGDWVASFSVQFDVDGTSETIDAWGAAVSYDADDSGTANLHLLTTTNITNSDGSTDTRDLSQIETLQVDGTISLN